MGETYRTMRRSIFTFLQNYQYFTSTPTLLAFPFALFYLVSQSHVSSLYFFPLVHGRTRYLFFAAGFPPSSKLFEIFNLKLSQTILMFFLVLPFNLSFLLLSKASTIKALEYCKTVEKHAFSHWIKLFNPLLITQLCNSIIMLAANATCLCLLVISFNILDFMGLSFPGLVLLLSTIGVVIYSMVLANANIMCELALILSGIQKHGGSLTSYLKAYVLIRDRTSTALSLAVTINMGLVGVEALFQYRVLREYRRDTTPNFSMVLEATLIAYLYAMLLVFNTIVGSVFLKSFEKGNEIDHEENMYCHRVEIQERDENNFAEEKLFELVP